MSMTTAEIDAALAFAKVGSVDYLHDLLAHMTEPKAEVLTAARSLTSADHGKTFFLGAAGGFAVTLPALELGFKATFVVKTPPTGVAYTIVTPGSADIIVANITDVTDPEAVTDDNADIVSLVKDIAVAGDWLTFECDGTLWYARGAVRADGGATTGTTP